MTDNKIRCEKCGKFISYNDFKQNKIHVQFTPDTHFTVEKTEYTHTKCVLN